MNVYTCNRFTGFYPVGSAAVIVARNRPQALIALNKALVENCMKGDAKLEDIWKLDTSKPAVAILVNGDY